MISKDLEDRYRKEIRRQMHDVADVVDGGGCTDWAHYKQLTGKIEGLAVAERAFLDLVELRDKEE